MQALRRVIAGLAVSSTLALALVLGACSSASKPAQAGGSCLQATDCAEGLICVQPKTGPWYCSSDVGLEQFSEEGGPADAQARADAGDATTATGDGGGQPVSDGASQADAASVSDAATSPVDSATPPADASTPVDAAPPVDAAAPVDAAPPVVDATTD